MKRYFFVCYGGGHAKMILPVVKSLQADEHSDVIVLALTTAASFFQNAGVKCLTMSSVTEFGTKSWRSLGEELVSTESLSSLISYEDSIAYHGVNFGELVATYGENKACSLYAASGRQAFFPINFFCDLLSKIKPDLVIATNSPRSERACIEAARQLSIPSICLVDMFALHEVNWIARNGFADKVCVLNEHVKSFFESRGRAAKDVVVTGNPAFDTVNSVQVRNTALELINSNSNYRERFVILYASQPEPVLHPFSGKEGNPSLPRDIETILRSYVAQKDDVHLIIRYHPSEKVTFLESKNVSFSSNNETLHPLLHVADIVAVTASTVGLEAYLASRHVVSVDCSIFTEDAPFSKMGISDGVPGPDYLPVYLDEFFSRYKRQDLTSSLVSDHLATSKVIAVIESML
ncbi:hypothetical protein [Rheinheimera sp.]|uniref:hypothetical protein n=1 Tax=Rheinheimera sp. TaxID=1869214 RepID=UPI0040481959